MGWYGCCCNPSCEACLPTETTVYVTLPTASDASGGPSCTGCNWLTTTFAFTYYAPSSSSTVKTYHYNGNPIETILCCNDFNFLFPSTPYPCTGYPCPEFSNSIPENPFTPSTNKCIYFKGSVVFTCLPSGDLRIAVTIEVRYYRNGDGCIFFSRHSWSQDFSSFDCPFDSKTVTNYTTLYGATTFGCPSPSNIGCEFSGDVTVYV